VNLISKVFDFAYTRSSFSNLFRNFQKWSLDGPRSEHPSKCSLRGHSKNITITDPARRSSQPKKPFLLSFLLIPRKKIGKFGKFENNVFIKSMAVHSERPWTFAIKKLLSKTALKLHEILMKSLFFSNFSASFRR
jgi:hypothetical protein